MRSGRPRTHASMAKKPSQRTRKFGMIPTQWYQDPVPPDDVEQVPRAVVDAPREPVAVGRLMVHPGPGHDEHLEAAVPRPEREIEVLAVREEAGIERADAPDHRRPDEHGAARGVVHLARRAGPLRPRPPPRLNGHARPQRERSADVPRPRGAAHRDDMRREQTRFRQPGRRLDEDVDARGLHDGVVVQEQDEVRATGHGPRDASRAPLREAEILGRAFELDAQRREPRGHRAVERERIVDQQDGARAGERVVGERLEAPHRLCLRAPVQDHHRDVRSRPRFSRRTARGRDAGRVRTHAGSLVPLGRRAAHAAVFGSVRRRVRGVTSGNRSRRAIPGRRWRGPAASRITASVRNASRADKAGSEPISRAVRPAR